jgi:hypothetical protein
LVGFRSLEHGIYLQDSTNSARGYESREGGRKKGGEVPLEGEEKEEEKLKEGDEKWKAHGSRSPRG